MDSAQIQVRYRSGERNFSGALLSGINLVWVDLRGIDLRGADLSYANLSGATLSESNFGEATNLSFADLSRADLRNANLKGARLEGANLEGVQLEGAIYDEHTKFPKGFNPQIGGAVAGGRLAEAGPESSSAVSLQAPQLDTVSDSNQDPVQVQPNNSPFAAESLDQISTGSPVRPTAARSVSSVQPQPPNPVVAIPAQPSSRVNSSTQNTQEFLRTTVPSTSIGSQQPSISETGRISADGMHSDWHHVPNQHWPPTPNLQTSARNSSGQGRSSVLPAGIRGWNWGAFLLPWIWFIPNQVWSGILLWLLILKPGWSLAISLFFALLFGFKGNEWAWKARPWDSMEAFRKHQRYWTVAGFLVLSLLIVLTLLGKP